jgi:hypothetical protein
MVSVRREPVSSRAAHALDLSGTTSEATSGAADRELKLKSRRAAIKLATESADFGQIDFLAATT